MSAPSSPSVRAAVVQLARERLAFTERRMAEARDWEEQAAGSLVQARERLHAAAVDLEAAGVALALLEPAMVPGVEPYTPTPAFEATS